MSLSGAVTSMIPYSLFAQRRGLGLAIRVYGRGPPWLSRPAHWPVGRVMESSSPAGSGISILSRTPKGPAAIRAFVEHASPLPNRRRVSRSLKTSLLTD